MILRIGSILLAIFLLLLTAPVLIPFLFLVYFEDRESPVLKQTRIGKNKVPFTCYKVRTMRTDTAQTASHDASTAQITKMGAILRKTGLDELPQIVNVLIGNMSFVGPRPCLPVQIELIEARDARGVFGVLPGITGRAQIDGVDMSNPEKLAIIDGEYVRTKTFPTDFKIAWATLGGKGSGDAIKR